MNALGSFLVAAAALFPVLHGHRRTFSPWLRWYLIAMAAHGALQGIMLAAGVSIASPTYGFEWYLARLVQLCFACGFFVETANRRVLRAGVSLSVLAGLILGVTPFPTVWFNWLAFAYAGALGLLGMNIVTAKDAVARLIGLYWCSMGCWQYAFARFSPDVNSAVWEFNWWLPAAISISAFWALGQVLGKRA